MPIAYSLQPVAYCSQRMNTEEIREYTLSLPEVEEYLPFGPDTLVFKVNNKIFLLLALESNPVQFNVKCDPDQVVLLREEYDSILPGYHMNKKHWNTILANGTLKNDFLKKMIFDSYNLVNKKTKQVRDRRK